MIEGLYFHIPYCKQLCPYCDFPKYKLGKSLSFENYNDLLIREIDGFSDWLKSSKVRTIYFGGGTPSLFPITEYRRLFDHLKRYIDLGPVEEITMEMDPDTFDLNFLRSVKELGFNRCSLGVQSFDDKNLEQLGRTHRKKDILKSIEWLSQNDLAYSLDMIFALPNQNSDSLYEELVCYIDSDAKHLSAYCLE
ncbi:MAG: radical SAM protein, partial [Bdellovibrionales bacterium]|nr:radical SAM protein [Bdellovibrionales bacterium]